MKNYQKLDFNYLKNVYDHNIPYQRIGKILSGQGSIYEVNLSKAILGSNVIFKTTDGEECFGEIVSINQKSCHAMPYKEIDGLNSQTQIILKDLTTKIKITKKLLGRVIDFQGIPMDGKGKLEGPFEKRSIFGDSINPLARSPITEHLDVGINAINGFMTVGMGQRIAIMAGSGVGKSYLLGMMAQKSNADINVIALVGERGREVLEFIENELGEEGLKKSVVVVATSDTSPLVRMRAAYVATTIAEYFRDLNNNVLFMMDSVTRFAMAGRELSLGLGDPPGPKGYTPTVFAKMAKLLERVGTKKGAGTITGIYSVLVEGDDMDEPVTDAVRSIIDGHVVLNREMAARNFYPAIDILNSVSRLMTRVATQKHLKIASYFRDLMAAYKSTEDLIQVGAYVSGSNVRVDKILHIYDDLMNLLKQSADEGHSIEELVGEFEKLVLKAERWNKTEDDE